MNNAKGTKSRYLLRLSYDCTQENQKKIYKYSNNSLGKIYRFSEKCLEGGMVTPNTSDYSFINFRSRSNMAL